MENESDEDCEYFLQPVSNQYNIVDKIKEANQQLYIGESVKRSSQPKVRFRDHQLVDYEPEEDEPSEVMDKENLPKADESSDDGYIDDEIPDNVEATEIDNVDEICEQLDDTLELSEKLDIEEVNENLTVCDENYSKDEFHAEDFLEDSFELPESNEIELTNGEQIPEKTGNLVEKRKKSKFRPKSTKVQPIDDDIISAADKQATKSRPKTCCEHKESDEYKQKLPKYNGYNSNYGLSKDEIRRREEELLKRLHKKQLRALEREEEKRFLAKCSEDAFAEWLYKKMRNPIKKSNPINMFDAKRKRQTIRQRQRIQRQMEIIEPDEDVDDEI